MTAINIMKLIINHWASKLCVLLVALAPFTAVQAELSLTQVWQVKDLATPESVLYVKQKQNEFLLVSLIDGVPTEADAQGGIAMLALDGTPIDKAWVTGLNAPKGMGIYNNKLYVADINEVVVIDIQLHKVIKKIPIPKSIFLNDVAVSANGDVFVSDTRLNHIYRIHGDKPQLYMDNIEAANGLTVAGKNLIVGAGKQLLQIDPAKKMTTLASGFAQGVDGVELIAPNEYIISCWPGLVYYVNAKGELQVLIDSQAEKINTADIGYNPTQRRVFVPNFFANTVTAYQLK